LHWLLVHPPLLGPAVLAPLAAELVRRGPVAGVPDLRPRVTEAPGWRQRWVAAAAASGPADAVLGFSGAGVTVPAVAAAVGARRLARVDALLPVRSGATVPDDDIRDRVAALVSDVRIADWTTWWGPDALPDLVPDDLLRAALRADGHRLPADVYDVAVPVPGVWPEEGAGYVQLSPAYADAAAEARWRGWPVAGGPDGSHLDVATGPETVADLLG
jgi:hypothetical protein